MRRTRIVLALAMAATAVAVVPPLADVANAEGSPASARGDLSIFPVLYNVGVYGDLALAVRVAPDGSIFIARKSGLVQKYEGPGDTSPVTSINIQSEVYDVWDHGMLGLALDPGFTNQGWVYVLYSYDKQPGNPKMPRWGNGAGDSCPDPPGQYTDGCVTSARISRFWVDASGHGGAEQVLVDNDANGGWCEQFTSHSVGSLAFDSYGALYASAGDGASFLATDWGENGGTLPNSSNPVIPRNPCGDPPGGVGGFMSAPTAEGGSLRAQSARSAYPDGYSPYDGAILRINKENGAALPDNPLVGNGIPGDDRIVAFGLRNGFRFNIRPGTRDIWVGDVGWDTWEEVSHFAFDPNQKVAGNFGWPCYEATATVTSFSYFNLCSRLADDKAAGRNSAVGSGGSSAALVQPLYTYQHGHPAVGGCTLSDSAVIGGPFITSNAWPADLRNSYVFGDYARGCIWAMRNANPNDIALLATGATLVDIQAGPSGDLYFLNGDTTTLYRIAPNNSNLPPIASFTTTPSAGPLPLNVTVNASASSDPNPGDSLTFLWDFDDDGGFDDGAGAVAGHTFTTPGAARIGLRVVDSAGAASTAYRTVFPANDPPVIHSLNAGGAFTANGTVSFTSNVTDDVALPPSAYSWQVLLHHCSRLAPNDCHVHTNTVAIASHSASGSFTAPDHDWPTWLELQLTVTDASGATATASTRIDPATAQLDLASNPAGVTLSVGGTSAPAPLSLTEIKGAHVQVNAPPTTVIGGLIANFTGWSDGTTSTTLDVTMSSSMSRTANYAVTSTPAPPPPPPAPPARSGPPVGASEWAAPWGDVAAIYYGWAADFDEPGAPVTVMYTINGRMAGLTLANRARPEVAAGNPPLSADHGFAAAITAPGTNVVVCGYALNLGPGANAHLGCSTFHRPVKPVVKAKTATKKKVVRKKKRVVKKKVVKKAPVKKPVTTRR